MQLTDDDALRPIDDELAAANHDGHVAEINLFLNRLLLVQAQPDAERAAVGQAQLPAFVRIVARLAQLVAKVFKTDRLVITFDGENLAQHAFQSSWRALVGRHLQLKKAIVRLGLHVGQRRNFDRIADATEISYLFRNDGPLGRDGHNLCSCPKRRHSAVKRYKTRRARSFVAEFVPS